MSHNQDVERVFVEAQRAFRADFPEEFRTFAAEYARERLFKACEGIDTTDPRFPEEAPTIARLYLAEEHAAFHRGYKAEAVRS